MKYLLAVLFLVTIGCTDTYTENVSRRQLCKENGAKYYLQVDGRAVRCIYEIK